MNSRGTFESTRNLFSTVTAVKRHGTVVHSAVDIEKFVDELILNDKIKDFSLKSRIEARKIKPDEESVTKRDDSPTLAKSKKFQHLLNTHFKIASALDR